jgi:hypothetical protein
MKTSSSFPNQTIPSSSQTAIPSQITRERNEQKNKKQEQTSGGIFLIFSFGARSPQKAARIHSPRVENMQIENKKGKLFCPDGK